MPEGPSILLVREALQSFIGKKVLSVKGNSKIEKSRLINQKITDVRSWGKHLLICFEEFTLRIHFLMFGTYLVNKRKPTPLRLSLCFKKDELNFYTCSVQYIDEPLNEVYDFSADVLNDLWSSRKASFKLRSLPEMNVSDVLLDQQIFSGVGNIIKNEVLFRIRVHPKSIVGNLPPKLKTALIREARNYSLDFLKWKRKFELKKHWLIYTKKTCPRDHAPVYKEHIGKTRRRTFYCEKCQILYG
ncbi:MAG TPA: DNA-formamidopyrimidine glycosylase family protein [Puia sp.]|nr:DNA-formamidopyrimidine glycosylase family protein [Puia sp.]